jgi:histone acetyltransferase (RNA polymerase elongator complex component)
LKKKPFVIPIFIPHAGCPHRCVFCDQIRTTRRTGEPVTTKDLNETVTRFLGYRKDPARFTELSFYGGNFLGLPAGQIRNYLAFAARYIHQGQAQGIRFSTRPDTIDQERLKLLAGFPVTTIEIGVQSMHDEVLAISRRGHSVQDIDDAVQLLKTTPYRIGLQMMVGLPGDSFERSMATGERIAHMQPDFVRIYPTLVLKGSVLARWYHQGRYAPLGLDEAVVLAKSLYAFFCRRAIKVIRLGLQATDGLNAGTDMVAGPYHPAFGELVYSALWLDMMRDALQKSVLRAGEATIKLHPKLLSRVKGHKNSNLKTLSREFSMPLPTISIDHRLPLDLIRINDKACRLLNSC